MINPMDMSGRTVLVTGASSGIGRETALLLSELGARVVLHGRDVERLREARERLSGEGHSIEPCDLAATAGISEWFRGVVSRSGPLYGLVHCAAIQRTIPLRILSPRDFDQHWGINVVAAGMLVKCFQQAGGCTTPSSIVLMSSAAGVVASPANSAYAATKGAIIALAKSLALELVPRQIRVNCILAALVETEMVQRERQHLAAESYQAVVDRHPMGVGQPRDIANAIAFLLADTGRWITGSALVVDGGYTAA